MTRVSNPESFSLVAPTDHPGVVEPDQILEPDRHHHRPGARIGIDAEVHDLTLLRFDVDRQPGTDRLQQLVGPRAAGHDDPVGGKVVAVDPDSGHPAVVDGQGCGARPHLDALDRRGVEHRLTQQPAVDAGGPFDAEGVDPVAQRREQLPGLPVADPGDGSHLGTALGPAVGSLLRRLEILLVIRHDQCADPPVADRSLPVFVVGEVADHRGVVAGTGQVELEVGAGRRHRRPRTDDAGTGQRGLAGVGPVDHHHVDVGTVRDVGSGQMIGDARSDDSATDDDNPHHMPPVSFAGIMNLAKNSISSS